jgi:chaperonin GroES
LIEQHLLYDLDDDGVKEPWIAIVHKEKKKLLRLVRGYELEDVMISIQGKRMPLMELTQGGTQEIPEELSDMITVSTIKAKNYFTKYSFIPSPNGDFYDIGFGHLIGPLMDSVDTLINQLIDSGTLNNLSGGFYDKGLRGSKGDIRLAYNEWKPVQTSLNIKLSDHFYQVPSKPPSLVLFNLLEFLLGSVKDITAVKDVLTGDTPAGMAEGSILALIEQGMQVYSSIYKRVYRCLKAELKVIYGLNRIFLEEEEYFSILDDGSQGVISLSDYRNDGTDVIPVADPSASTKMQEMAKAQFLLQFVGNPKFNQDEIYTRLLTAGGFRGIDKLLIADEDMPKPQPDPAMIAMAENLKSETDKNLKQIEELDAKITNWNAKSIESLSKAEAQEAGVQFDEYKTQMEELRKNHELFERMKGMMNEQTGLQTMEDPARNGMVLQDAGGGAVGGPGGLA